MLAERSVMRRQKRPTEVSCTKQYYYMYIMEDTHMSQNYQEFQFRVEMKT